MQKWYKTLPSDFEEPDGDSKAERAMLAPRAEEEPYWDARLNGEDEEDIGE